MYEIKINNTSKTISAEAGKLGGTVVDLVTINGGSGIPLLIWGLEAMTPHNKFNVAFDKTLNDYTPFGGEFSNITNLQLGPSSIFPSHWGVAIWIPGKQFAIASYESAGILNLDINDSSSLTVRANGKQKPFNMELYPDITNQFITIENHTGLHIDYGITWTNPDKPPGLSYSGSAFGPDEATTSTIGPNRTSSLVSIDFIEKNAVEYKKNTINPTLWKAPEATFIPNIETSPTSPADAPYLSRPVEVNIFKRGNSSKKIKVPAFWGQTIRLKANSSDFPYKSDSDASFGYKLGEVSPV